ncbi:MAG: hypothetical protein LBD48_15055, partial [Treponema sp.]|nr:hypothetical protein [Treponema sp.]
GDLSRRCGLIRYSRFLDAPRAIALLEANKPEEAAPLPGGQPSPAPVLTEIPLSIRALTDLEILRRRTEIDETARLLAETWLLAGNYPEAEPLYRWGAWFFDLQRSYGETALLLKNAAHHGFTGQWMNLHEALGLIREGNLDRAESLLTSIPAASAEWASHANLGRILEARRIPAKALEHYETAAAQLAGAPVAASRVQVRIAQCLKTLGRVDESRRVLEYALDLNPENLNARLELHRLE